MGPLSASPHQPIVIKVGGSLYDLPDLGPRLQSWLDRLNTPYLILVPGGGAMANVVRAWDQVQGLGEEKSHWLALKTLTSCAHFLASLLPGTHVIEHLDDRHNLVVEGKLPILDMHAWASADDKRPDHLPHAWNVTSDSLALRVAFQSMACQVILLKSVDIPEGMAWQLAAQQGLVDGFFPEALKQCPDTLVVQAINFRKLGS